MFTFEKYVPMAKKSGYTLYFDKLNIVYTYIPKCGCTTLKMTLAKNNDGISDIKYFKIHEYIQHKALDKQSFENKDFVKLIVFRDPFARICSGYIDKIIKKEKGFSPYIEMALKGKHGRQLPSFLEFISFLYSCDLRTLNDHFLPQCEFIYFDTYDYIFDLKDIDTKWAESSLSYIQLETHKEHSAISGRNIYTPSDIEDVASLNGEKLSELIFKNNTIPSYESFFSNTEAKGFVEEIYKKDIEIYNNIFVNQESHHEK